MMVILNYLSGNSYTSFCLGFFLGGLFYSYDWAMSYFFLCFVGSHAFETTATFPSLYRWALFREISSPFSLVTDAGGGVAWGVLPDFFL